MMVTHWDRFAKSRYEELLRDADRRRLIKEAFRRSEKVKGNLSRLSR